MLSLDVVVGVGASTGAAARYGVGHFVLKLNSSTFPWGTFLANVVGAFLLGLCFREFQALQSKTYLWLLLGTGFCGGFTTFSTLTVETVSLMKTNKLQSVGYLTISLLVGCLLFWVSAFYL